MDKNGLYSERTDDELYAQFTKYVKRAIEGCRAKYIKKCFHVRATSASLEELLAGEDPILAADDPELELVLDNMESLEQMICNDALLVAILRLSDRERRVMNLHLVHKMKHREIADLLGVTVNTIELCYARSIKKLREYLKEERG